MIRPTVMLASSCARGRAARALRRLGAATLDYVLLMGVLLFLSSLIVHYSRRIMVLTYEMINVLVAWPFM